MKSWQKGPDDILLDSLKMTALMSFCFGVGLLASSIIGVGAQSQFASTIDYTSSSTDTTSGISDNTSNTEDTNNTTVTQTSTTTTNNNTTTGLTSGTGGTYSYISPSLSFTSAVPSVVASDFSVTLNVVSIYRPRLVVRGLNVNKIIVLDPVSQQLPTVNFLVRFSQLPPGRYELLAKGYTNPDGSMIEVIGPKFEILAPVLVEQNSTTGPNSGTSSSTSVTTSTVNNNGAGSVSSTSSTTTNANITLEEDNIPELNLIIPNQSIFKGFVPVQVRTTVSLPEAFIYLQSPKFLTPRFVGKARYYDNSTLLLMIDTNQLPNGEHRIYASAKLSDINIESEKRKFVIENSTSTKAVVLNPTISTTTNPNLTTQPIIPPPKPAIVEPVNVQPVPTYVPPKEEVKIIKNDDSAITTIKKEPVNTGSGNTTNTVSLSDTLKALIPQLLKEYEPEINQSLKAFGEDLHNKDANVSDLRKKAEDDLLAILLDDYRLRSTSAEARKRIRAEVVRLVYRAEQVELLIIKAEVSSAGLDEVMKVISESIVPAEDSLVDTSSPREFGLVREDILKIESVSPVLSSDIVSTTTKVYTEIKGRAIPNSLVTLYIYSTPVMVTVRADKDGTFLYVYEKDLDDGDHEVYVALTTTEGEVVVKSPVFQFIREVQAFNSPDTGNGDSLVPATAGTPLTKNPYFIVLSITLLVISFIFFLLGFQTVGKPRGNRLM